MDDFDKSSKDNRVQARDKDTGLPMWQVEVLDFDPQAREKTFKVKIAAGGAAGAAGADRAQVPVRPVVLDGLTVTPYIKEVRTRSSGRCRGRRRRCRSGLQPALHGSGCAGCVGPNPEGGLAVYAMGRRVEASPIRVRWDAVRISIVGADPGLAVQDDVSRSCGDRPLPGRDDRAALSRR